MEIFVVIKVLRFYFALSKFCSEFFYKVFDVVVV